MCEKAVKYWVKLITGTKKFKGAQRADVYLNKILHV